MMAQEEVETPSPLAAPKSTDTFSASPGGNGAAVGSAVVPVAAVPTPL